MNVRSTPCVKMIEWRSLGAADRDAVLNLTISAQQVEFAGTIERSVAACETGDAAQVAGLAIRADDAIVGWVLLKRAGAAPDWVEADAALVGGLRIDARHQGRGIGSLALAGLAGWVIAHWPQAARLVLRVDDDNVAGIRAYEKAGWREIGERRTGRVGIERTMSQPLREPSFPYPRSP